MWLNLALQILVGYYVSYDLKLWFHGDNKYFRVQRGAWQSVRTYNGVAGGGKKRGGSEH